MMGINRKDEGNRVIRCTSRRVVCYPWRRMLDRGLAYIAIQLDLAC